MITLDYVLRKGAQSNWPGKQARICVLCDAFYPSAAKANHRPCLRDFPEVHGYRSKLPGVSSKPYVRAFATRVRVALWCSAWLGLLSFVLTGATGFGLQSESIERKTGKCGIFFFAHTDDH